eukprot:g36938.t1
MTRDIERLVKKKKEACVRFRKLEANKALKELEEAKKNLNKKLGGLEEALKYPWQHVDIKEEVVLGTLKNIKVDKTPVPDGIYSKVLKESRKDIAGALIETFHFLFSN